MVTGISAADFERATDEAHAADLVQAHLFEMLTCVGRDFLDVYFLRIRRAVEEYQIAGALMTLELAKQEGHIRFLGIYSDGPAMATLGMWQFHDAFELLLVPKLPEPGGGEAYTALTPLAHERRVGVVALTPLSEFASCANHPTMVAVRSADEVKGLFRFEATGGGRA